MKKETTKELTNDEIAVKACQRFQSLNKYKDRDALYLLKDALNLFNKAIEDLESSKKIIETYEKLCSDQKKLIECLEAQNELLLEQLALLKDIVNSTGEV